MCAAMHRPLCVHILAKGSVLRACLGKLSSNIECSDAMCKNGLFPQFSLNFTLFVKSYHEWASMDAVVMMLGDFPL